jgi:hypothetical protein
VQGEKCAHTGAPEGVGGQAVVREESCGIVLVRGRRKGGEAVGGRGRESGEQESVVAGDGLREGLVKGGRQGEGRG